ncbi:MAG: TetR/AcrR family transcriptional regulator [Sphingopyxis sp.]|nr:TetR/AcrR family transcriptional regulator [Sphingopyxis sp.]
MARRSAVDAAATRTRILDAARRKFAIDGYGGASARDIAAEAGVTVGALFHHFGSKAALFRAVFEILLGELNDAALASFRDAKTDDPLDAMIASFGVALGFAEKPDFHRIITVDGPVVLGTEEWRAIDSRMGLQTVAGGLAMLKAKGRIGDFPTKPLAVLVMGAMNNSGFALARGEKGVDVESLKQALRRLIEGLAPKCQG